MGRAARKDFLQMVRGPEIFQQIKHALDIHAGKVHMNNHLDMTPRMIITSSPLRPAPY